MFLANINVVWLFHVNCAAFILIPVIRLTVPPCYSIILALENNNPNDID